MAAPTKRRLYGPSGWATVRSAIAQTDAADWTPAALQDPDSVILDAREWTNVRLVSNRTATVQVLFHRRNADGSYTWVQVAEHNVTATGPAIVTVDGHHVAFRVSAVVLGQGETLDLRVTGGAAIPTDQLA